jgi:integrase
MIIKPILGHHEKTDGTRQVKIYIYNHGKKDLIPTEYYVRKEDWDKGKVKKGRPNADRINAELNIKISELESTWLSKRNITVSELREDKGELSLFGFINQYCQDIKSGKVLNKGQSFSPNTIKSYFTYTKYLSDFDPKLNWKDINEKFYDDYVIFLRTKYGENTIAKAIKVLKVIMKKGSKYHSNNQYVNFTASYQESDAIALTEREINLIMDAELPEHLEAERNRFFLSYNLFLRFGDSINLEKRDISKKDNTYFATVVHEKTKNSATIPLFKRSVEILEKYKYKLPPTTNQESNWKLKEIGKEAGIESLVTITKIEKGKVKKITAKKYNFITTHTARRSMATNYYLSMVKHGNVDLKSLQLMGGWKSITVLEKYLRIDKLQNALKASEHPFFN